MASETPDGSGMSGKELYFRLLQRVKPYWKQFGGALSAMIILAMTEPLIPILMKPMLDGSFVAKDPDYIFWSPILLILLFTVRGVMNFVTSVAFEWVAGKVVLDLRRSMIERILTMGTPYFDSNATGTLISKVTYNVNQVTMAATKVLTTIVKDTIVVIGLMAYMLYLNWMLTMVIFLALPVIVITVRLLAVRLRRVNRSLQSTMGVMTQVLEESVRGHKVIKIFEGRPYEQKRFLERANWVRRYNMKSKVAGSAHMPLVEIVGATMIAALVYVSTHDTVLGELTIGGFVSLMAAIGLLFSPLKRLTGINQPLQKGLAAAETVFGLIDEPAEADDGKSELQRVAGRVTFESVSFRYPNMDKDALKPISFEIAPGSTVALVGHSGGGKTTIANLIPRFYNPSGGRILIDEVDTQDLSLLSLRRQLSYVGQESVLFDDTVAANIAYGAQGEPTMEQIREAAKSAHALEFIERLPEGFDTRIGEDGVRLSGGQRQRLAIARALIKDAPILLLDEATSALDTESERHVQAALQALTRERTTLVIAHRLSTIQHADTILVVHDGELIEQGRHQQLIEQQGAYYQLCRHQFSEHFDTGDEG
ncbi:MAG: lipid A export permease/ATP-binding protein MsbA [Candidatus Thiodiazotropha lotti]|uniref:Lipid A export permease/ATP-binding protein MsbA n=1 Tax=Candidatus Thiodiazotropha lotti TaxID=2792787 RepID=A0A9E4K9Q7_9GAMM|nr:lipid A export permease/ATP-binding protein MsbA [Candidatus Thiodiazotropha lotti]MCG7922527.1 lipid A export permease/ATP-binding protein MsbA [Candidatus Thiodiazotropha lotti]MCG7932650.1 lipid A export permease/ATP-binding protein MsbA [Candidatus Thiodiazotropha lotti]MCG7941438.1 lipid A export permease/ATP-binding protein MsbA [Candidatus Thiodiazotropha lotti]MCG7986616.1 lipid A export permease/ATP-binding protein MsbA [Candidatus Thiodiazotropha lotti]